MPRIAEIEPTPNPYARRFKLRAPLTRGVTRSFESPEAARDDALATALFAVPHVTSVFYVDTYLTVTQDGAVPWPELERRLAPPIREAAADPDPAPPEVGPAPWVAALGDDDRARVDAIERLLDERVRPALLRDGGGLVLAGLAGCRLLVRYQGACGTCPSSVSATLLGIRNLLRTLEPDLELVLA
jgi:Fe-S cluster biogenesis protein NfuA